MGRTPAYHHVGTVLLLVAMILMVVVCISTPLVNDLYLLKATVSETASENANATIRAGIFGYCLGDKCTSPQVSYDQTLLTGGKLDLNDVFNGAMSYALVLTPVSAGFTFLAFLFAFGGQSIWGSIATFFSLWSFILTIVALGVDAGFFGLAMDRLNRSDNIQKGSVQFGHAMWLVVASAGCQFLATLIICCSRRSIRKQKANERVNLPLTRQDTRASDSSDIPLREKGSGSSQGHFRRRSNPGTPK